MLVRLAQKAKEQRVRRDALHETARQKQEAMRTGRVTAPAAQPSARSAGRPPEPSPAAARQERIEALRKERMEQLRALREKRAGSATPPAGRSAATSASGISQNHPNLPPLPVQARSQMNPSGSNQRAAQPRQQAGQRAGQRRTSVPTPQGRGQAQNRARRPQVIATSAPAPQSRRRSITKSTPARLAHSGERQAGKIENLSDFKQSNTPKRSAQQTAQSARSMLHSRSSIRQAMILREVLDRPIALRDQEIASGSLLS